MEMQQSIKLNSKEQKLEWTLLALASVFIILIIVGVISQSRGVNYDYILVPAFFFSGGLFFLLFGLNGIAKGQLIEKWSPFVLTAWTKAIMQIFVMKEKGAQTDVWKITLGLAAVLVGLICIATAINDIYKHL